MKYFYKEDKRKKPKVGYERIKTLFTIFPVFVWNGWAWLSIVKVKQRYYFSNHSLAYRTNGWNNIEIIK